MPSHVHSNMQLVHTWIYIYMTQLAWRLIQYFKSMAISQSWYEWPLFSHAQIVTVKLAYYIPVTFSITLMDDLHYDLYIFLSESI